jgi:hypothetical protein
VRPPLLIGSGSDPKAPLQGSQRIPTLNTAGILSGANFLSFATPIGYQFLCMLPL